MNKIVLKRLSVVSFISLSLMSLSVNSATIQSVVNAEKSSVDSFISSQKRIDSIYKRTEKARNDSITFKKEVKGMLAYNARMNKVVTAQNKAKSDLLNSIKKVDDIERQILPLIISMLDSIDFFIADDMPFLREQREQSVSDIRGFMLNSRIAVSERLRLVLDLYNREIGYGKSIEAYSDSISYEGKSIEVDILRIGRVALYFQTKDELVSGVWKEDTSVWLPLDGKYSKPVRQAIKIAQQKVSPDLLRDLPLFLEKATQ